VASPPASPRVERQPDAELVQALDHALPASGLVHARLAHLDQQPLRRDVVACELRGHAVHVAVVAQLARRRVDGHPRQQPRGGPRRRLPAGRLEHPLADQRDQAVLVGVGDERVRAEQARLGVVPAHERLDSAHVARDELVHRLVVEDELLLGQRAPDPRREREPAPRLAGVVGIERRRAPARALGLVHRGVRVLEQRSVERREDLRRRGARSARGILVAQPGQQQHELDAAEPREQIAAARHDRDPPRDLDERSPSGRARSGHGTSRGRDPCQGYRPSPR
jgi:hypothetical protein